MSSGLEEWEKGIPCMLHGSGSWGGRHSGGDGLGLSSAGRSCYPLLAACPCAVSPLPRAVGREWGAVALVYSACFNLGSQG